MMVSRLRDAWAIPLFAALVLWIQSVSGAWSSDFTSDEDEPAHAVSSLMVRDYLAAGIPQNPLHFAENYYLHYPKVAIGHWPPLFYAAEGLWMLLCGRSRIAMLTFVAVCAILLLTSVFVWMKRDYGASAAFISSFALAAPAFMQTAMDSVAPNIVLALLSFWSAVVFGEYLEHRRKREAILFGGLVLLAIGVHGRGAAVALLPVVAIFMEPFRWTKPRIVFLVAMGSVALLALRFIAQAGVANITALPGNAAFFFYQAGAAMSWPIILLAVVGAVFAIRESSRRALAMVALAIGCWMFHSVVNAGWGDRYLATAAPAIAILSGVGFNFVRKKLASRVWTAVIATLICADLAWTSIPLVHKPDLGYHRLAEVPNGVTLIAASALHEGAFVSEMALRDRRLDRIVLRGSKVLASSEWSGRNYRVLFSSPQELSGYLDVARVETAMIEEFSVQPHVRLLLDSLRADPRWRLSHLAEQPSGIVIFQRTVPLPPGHPLIRIDMHRGLGTTIENK